MERHEVKAENTWDLSPLFENESAWEAERTILEQELGSIREFQGKLTESSTNLRNTLDRYFVLSERLEKIYTYAHLKSDEDTRDSSASSLLQKAQSIWLSFSAASSYIAPELMSVPTESLNTFFNDEILVEYKIYLKELVRQKAHIRSSSEEEILSLAGEVLGSSRIIFRQLNDADLSFESVLVDGELTPLTHGSFITFLLNPDRSIRESAFNNYYKSFDNHKYTLTSTLTANLKKDTFIAKVRGYKSSRDKGLFGDAIPESVYDTLISSISSELDSSLHCYYQLRKDVLSLPEQRIFDTYVPLIPEAPKGVTYDEAVNILREALLPLGEEYVSTLAEGLTTRRWVDRYENKGKRSGAYSSGCYKSPPYILMNYKESSIESLYTLAHEAGHSMHTWYANRNQNYPNHGYTIFVAEVASTTNEMLLTKYLLEHNNKDEIMCAYLRNYQLDAIKATFFRQTMFAEFEHKTHFASDTNEPLTLESYRHIYRTLQEKYFGQSVKLGELDDLECFKIPHFYSAFYVFKYATGLAAAITLAEDLYKNDLNAKNSYLEFLAAGGSKYPLDALRDAGVDLEKPNAVNNTIKVFRDNLKVLCQMRGWQIPSGIIN